MIHVLSELWPLVDELRSVNQTASEDETERRLEVSIRHFEALLARLAGEQTEIEMLKKALAIATSRLCLMVPASSRVCELGTKGCNYHHEV
jgi:hypothetical protein